MERCYSDHPNATFKEKCALPLVHGIPIVVINYILTFIGTFGNFLIIFAVLNTPKLRHKISNFLLVSLAAADLFVTMFAQPLNATAVAFTTFRRCCIPELDFAYDFAGNFSVFNSLFHLACISIDRALVVRKPHQHHNIMSRYGLKIMLCICWPAATIFAIVRVNFSNTLMASIGLVVFNFAIIIASYAVIIYEIKRERLTSQNPAGSISSRDARMEKRVAGTIAIIILFFSVCWFPLLGFYISVGQGFLRDLGGPVYMWIRTLVLCNSSMNFIVYSCRIEHFRVAYMRIINRILQSPREALGIPGKFATASHGHVSNVSKDNDIMELTTPSAACVKKDKVKKDKVGPKTNAHKGVMNCGRETDCGKESGASECEENPQDGNVEDEIQATPMSAQVHFDDSESETEDPVSEIPTITPKVTFNGEPETLFFDQKPKMKQMSLKRNSKKFKLEKK